MVTLDFLKQKQPIHFVGIGGIGMSALAALLHHQGLRVQGSDSGQNAQTAALSAQGITVFNGHTAQQINGVGAVVLSTAIAADNPERVAAQNQKLPLLHRADILAALLGAYKSVAVTGTHGKTTTTALTFTLLNAAGLAPGVLNGGVLFDLNSNLTPGAGTWMVAEADESDKSFLKLFPHIGVLLNMDEEHLEHYPRGLEEIRQAFDTFAAQVAPEGTLILGSDHPEIAALAKRAKHPNVLTFGLNLKADIRAENIRYKGFDTVFDLWVKDTCHRDVKLALPGEHNVKNALAAAAACVAAGGNVAQALPALAHFGGVKRRFNRLGTLHGYTVIDDYAHHPEEITATIKAARRVFGGRLAVVFQPHRYTRLAGLMEGFVQALSAADDVLLAPVYAAHEQPIAGATSDVLAQRMCSTGKQARVIENCAEVAACLYNLPPADSAVLFLGAGTITQWAQDVAE